MFQEMLENVRGKCPLIHNITNYVTVNDCANIILAAGGSPTMAHDLREVEEAQLAAQQGEAPNVIVCREGLLPLAESVVGSRRMVRAVRTATVLSYIGALCGVALSYYLTSVGNFAVLTPLSMVVFLLLWLLPTLLIAGLVRHF